MGDPLENPLILGFVADLFFVVKIQAVMDQLNYRVKWIENADQIAPPDPSPLIAHLGEPVFGREAILLEQITLWQPAMMIFDLNNQAIPWQEWIRLVTSVPATRRIPVVCFGSHKDVESIKSAKSAGAKAVVARSAIVDRLPDLLQEFARVADHTAIKESCNQPLSEEALIGLEEFNRGAYFEAHEYLEKAWMSDISAGRDLYRAILQVAVAYYQIQRGNYNGAVKIFLRVRQWIDPLPGICRGVDIGRLRSEAQTVNRKLKALGPDRISEFDIKLLKPVIYQIPENKISETDLK